MSNIFGRFSRENIIMDKVFLIFVYQFYDYYEIGFCSRSLFIVYDLGYCLLGCSGLLMNCLI